MSEFDEWFKNRHTKTGLYEEALCGKDNATYIRHEMRKAYKAGQQSQQAKIDQLNEKHSEEKRILHNVIEMNQAKIDELQARIDEALRHVIDHGGYDDLTHVIDILKGNKDEN